MLRTLAIILSLGLATAAAQADTRADIAKKFPGATAEDVRPAPVPGLFELRRGGDIVYVTPDARYAFTGDLYDLGSNNNLSEARRRGLRQELLAAVPDSQTLVFSPQDPKYTISVFTDVDCGYCRKLHGEIKQYLDAGIEVRYLFFPRAGEGSDSYKKAVTVWCSDNRNQALTKAKKGENLPEKSCDNPVSAHMALGNQFGASGTPMIVTEKGSVLPGYVPASQLMQVLEQEKKS